MQMLALKEIHMTYGKGDGVVHALRGVDMEVERGELLAVTGKSGCGIFWAVCASRQVVPIFSRGKRSPNFLPVSSRTSGLKRSASWCSTLR